MKTKVFFYSLMMGLVMVSSTLNVFAEIDKERSVIIRRNAIVREGSSLVIFESPLPTNL